MFVDQQFNSIHVGMPIQRRPLTRFVATLSIVAEVATFPTTDVDDKIINRAKKESITPQEVADKYIAAFREDVAALALNRRRVVEFMDDIIRLSPDLIEKG